MVRRTESFLRFTLGLTALSGCQLYSLQDACGPNYGDNQCVIPTGGGTGGGGMDSGIGTPCTPPVGSGTDPCAANGAGLACNANASGTGDSCTLPTEYEACTSSAGCAADTPALTCTDVQFSGGTSASQCVFTCTSTDDCVVPSDTCQGTICYSDECGPGFASDGGGLFAPCDSVGVGDGTCLPQTATYAICVENGALQANQTGCGSGRLPSGSTSDLCAAGSVCVAATDGSFFCAPVCANPAVTPGPGCTTGLTCYAVLGSGYGTCLQTCSNSNACPSGFTCQASGYCEP